MGNVLIIFHRTSKGERFTEYMATTPPYAHSRLWRWGLHYSYALLPFLLFICKDSSVLAISGPTTKTCKSCSQKVPPVLNMLLSQPLLYRAIDALPSIRCSILSTFLPFIIRSSILLRIAWYEVMQNLMLPNISIALKIFSDYPIVCLSKLRQEVCLKIVGHDLLQCKYLVQLKPHWWSPIVSSP